MDYVNLWFLVLIALYGTMILQNQDKIERKLDEIKRKLGIEDE